MAIISVAIFRNNIHLLTPIAGGMGTSGMFAPLYALIDNDWSSWAFLFSLLFLIAIPIGIGIPATLLFFKKEWYKKEELILKT